MRIVKSLALATGFTAALAVAAPGFAGGNKYDSHTLTRACGDGDTVVWNGANTLWPPNHKMVPVSVSANGGKSTEMVSITVTPTVDDVSGGDGGPQHDPDYTPGDLTANGTGTATEHFELRAERSGQGTGRTYTINWSATFDGKKCASSDQGQTPFSVYVPHDMRDKNSYS